MDVHHVKFIGIDVSKLSLDCAWLRNLDQNKAKRKRVENSPQDFKALLTWAQDVSGLAANELSLQASITSFWCSFSISTRQRSTWLTHPWSGSSPRAWAF